jgi:hypothetical protein
VWPEAEFPRTHTLKVKRQDVLNRLQEIRDDSPGLKPRGF